MTPETNFPKQAINFPLENRVTLSLRDGTTVTGTYLGTAFNTLLKLRLDNGALQFVRMAELAVQP